MKLKKYEMNIRNTDQDSDVSFSSRSNQFSNIALGTSETQISEVFSLVKTGEVVGNDFQLK